MYYILKGYVIYSVYAHVSIFHFFASGATQQGVKAMAIRGLTSLIDKRFSEKKKKNFLLTGEK